VNGVVDQLALRSSPFTLSQHRARRDSHRAEIALAFRALVIKQVIVKARRRMKFPLR